MTHIWTDYQLRSNPFFQDELTVDPDGDHPVSLLIGRAAELRLLHRHVVGNAHSRVIVEGAAGVGKTSLVNRFKSELERNGYLIHPNPIRVQSGMTARDFTAEALRELLRIRNRERARPSGFRALVARIGDAAVREADAFWTEAGRIVNGQVMTGIGLSGGVFGAQIGAQTQPARVPADVPLVSLSALFAEAIQRAVSELGRNIVFHVNNLENLSDRDAAAAAGLVQDLRDDLKIPGAHWIFVGTLGVEDAVFRRTPQVSGFFPAAIRVEPLSPDQVAEMLSARYRHLRLGLTPVIAPIEPADAAAIYRRFFGDLRNFLRLLNDAAMRVLGVEGIRPMTPDDVLRSMAGEYRKRIEGALSDTIATHLRTTVAGDEGPRVYRFRHADVSARCGIKGPAAKRVMDALRTAGLIEFDRAEGQSEWYRVCGDVSVAYGLPGPE